MCSAVLHPSRPRRSPIEQTLARTAKHMMNARGYDARPWGPVVLNRLSRWGPFPPGPETNRPARPSTQIARPASFFACPPGPRPGRSQRTGSRACSKHSIPWLPGPLSQQAGLRTQSAALPPRSRRPDAVPISQAHQRPPRSKKNFQPRLRPSGHHRVFQYRAAFTLTSNTVTP